MNQDSRATQRGLPLSREDWITKFVNAVVRELRPGTARMVAVAAAREAWPGPEGTSPFAAAKAWVDAGGGASPGEA